MEANSSALSTWPTFCAMRDTASAGRTAVPPAGLKLTEALRFASLNPARFLGAADRLGRLAPLFRADMIALDPNAIAVTGTWVAGEYLGIDSP